MIKLKILFTPCGIGLGHASRSIKIAEKLRLISQNYDIKLEILFSTYGSAVELIRRTGFQVFKVPEVSYFQKLDGTFDFKQTMSRGTKYIKNFINQISLELKHILRFKPHVVVSDSRLSSIIASRILGIPCALISNQLALIIPRTKPMSSSIKVIKELSEKFISNFMSLMWNFSKQIFVPDLPPKIAICRFHVQDLKFFQDKIEFTGPIVSILPNELPSSDKLISILKLKKSLPLIFGTISGLGFEKSFLAKILIRSLYQLCDQMNFQSVITLSNPSSYKVILNKDRIRILSWTNRYYEYLKVSNININHAGHTSIIEAICYGVPMILIPARGHTERISNATIAEKLGIAVMLTYDELSIDSLIESVKFLYSNDRVKRRIKALQKIALKMNGAKRIAERILNLALEE